MEEKTIMHGPNVITTFYFKNQSCLFTVSSLNFLSALKTRKYSNLNLFGGLKSPLKSRGA